MVIQESKHILSYGGGVNTVALMILLINQTKPLDEVVFADTGGEVPETYEYIPIAKDYLSKHGIPFKTVKAREHEGLYECCSRRRVIPSALWRWSTRDFKVRPIHAYYRTLKMHVNQYLGIAYDEFMRMKDSQVEYVTNLYPLVDQRITREQCIEIIQSEGLPIPVKSGCFFCPFSSLGRWKWLYENHSDLYLKAIELEENSKHFPDQRLTDQVFRNRAKLTLRDLADKFAQHIAVGESESQQTPCGGECMT